MLVNPNLIIDSALDNPKYWSSYKDFKKDGSIVTAIFDRPTSLGLILETSEDLKADTDYTLSIYTKGTKEYKLDYNYMMYGKDGNLSLKVYSELLSPNIWHKVTLPMKHGKDYSFKNIMVGHNYKSDESMELSFKYPKLEVGDQATPYIPNKDSLDPSKQAIFKTGGVFQEVYPL